MIFSREKSQLPLPLRILTQLHLVACVFCTITGFQLLYNNIIFRTYNLLCLVFIVAGLLFLASFRGLLKREKWSRTFSIFMIMLLLLFAVYNYKPSLPVPYIVTGLWSVAAIAYLKQYRIAQFFVGQAPSLLKNTGIYTILLIVGLTMLVPFLWMVSTSMKEPAMIFKNDLIPIKRFINIDDRRYQVQVKTLLTEVIYEDGDKKGHREFIKGERIALVHADAWLWPWRLKKWRHVLREKSNKGGIISTPVKVCNSRAEIKIISEGPHKSEVMNVSRSRIFSRPCLRLKNYPESFAAIQIGRLYWNSIKIAVLVTLGQVFSSSLAGYAFSRLHFPGRDKIFLAYLATMMVPTVVTMIPLFIMFRKTQLIDTHTAVILPGIFSAYGTFMLRQFFMSIPKDLEEAAKIDGCNLFSVYWRIILPLAKPALATLATFTFMANWRSFIWPLVVIHSQEKMTLPVGLASFMGQYDSEWHLLMAGTVMTLVPMILVFLFNQRYFVKGIQLGAVKG
jgi:multiple sugar transport system permease protein